MSPRGWSVLISDFKLHPIILRENWSFSEPSLNACKVIFLMKWSYDCLPLFLLNYDLIMTVKANDVLFDVQIMHCRLMFWPCAAICLCLSDLFLRATSYVQSCCGLPKICDYLWTLVVIWNCIDHMITMSLLYCL